MNHHCTVALVSCLGLALAGCSREAPPTPPEPVQELAASQAAAVGYVCESGKTIAVTYPDQQAAQLSYDGQDYVLVNAVAASGARYAGQGMEWWTASRNGSESATLSRLDANDQAGGAVLERCSRPVAALAPAPTPELAAANLPPCRSADLKLTVEGGDAGMGNRVSTLALQNLGAQACQLTGFAGVSLKDHVDRPLTAIKSLAEPGNYFNKGTAPTTVAVRPQAKAVFDLAWNVIPHEAEGETQCPDAKTLQLTVPGNAIAISMPFALSPCGRQVKVGPFRAPDPSASGSAPQI